MKNNLSISKILVCFIAILSMTLVACKNYEERIIDRLNNLADKVEKDGSKWNYNQWSDALAELDDIRFNMKDCEFTAQQLQEVGKAEGRLTVAFLTEGAKVLGEEFTNFLNEAGSFMQGFREGLEESSGLENLKNIESTMEEEFNNLMNEINSEQE